jgi:hypothetical protein
LEIEAPATRAACSSAQAAASLDADAVAGSARQRSWKPGVDGAGPG